jgi:uncharacterized protein YjbJ (UPF0337 family)
MGVEQEATVRAFLTELEGDQLDAAQIDRVLDRMSQDARYQVYAWEDPLVGQGAIRAELVRQGARSASNDPNGGPIRTSDSGRGVAHTRRSSESARRRGNSAALRRGRLAGDLIWVIPAKDSQMQQRQMNQREERAMTEKDSGPEAGVKGVVEAVKGKAKEVAGAVTGKEKLRKEGKAQQEKADALRDVAVKEAEAEKARAEAKGHEVEQRSHED